MRMKPIRSRNKSNRQGETTIPNWPQKQRWPKHTIEIYKSKKPYQTQTKYKNSWDNPGYQIKLVMYNINYVSQAIIEQSESYT